MGSVSLPGHSRGRGLLPAIALALAIPAEAAEIRLSDAYRADKIAGLRSLAATTETGATLAATCSTPCSDGTLLAAQPFYEVLLACGSGRFAARTGAEHPLTLATGAKQDVVFAGALGLPDFADFTLRVHDTDTSYSLPAGGEACTFDPPDTAFEPGNVGLREEWAIAPISGVELRLRQEVVAFGGEAEGSGVRLTLEVENLSSSAAPVTIGLRWQIDFANGDDDGPLAAIVACEPLGTGADFTGEHELAPNELGSFLRLRNNQGAPAFSNYLATVALTGFADTRTPDRVVFGEWGSLSASPWGYLASEGDTSVDLDSAVLFYYGYAESDGMTVAPGQVVRRSVVLASSASPSICPIATCATSGSPRANAGSDVSFCPGDSVMLDASGTVAPSCPGPLEYRWSDPSGMPMSQWTTAPTRPATPGVSGAYAVEARCAAYPNCVAMGTVAVTAVAPPVAAFLAPTEVCFGCAAASLVDASQGSIVAWSWTFGDGSASTEQHPRHVFRAPGDLPVRLTVTDVCGATSVYEQLVRVVGVPEADFSLPASACSGGAVSFTNLSSGDATGFRWDFGDGSPVSSAVAPVHTFATGSYEVSLLASNGCGDSDPVRRTIIVADGPAAAFTSDAPRCEGPVRFRDSSVGEPVDWTWDFGDGSPRGSGPNPTHDYAASGTYSVSLTATSACGSGTTMRSVTVSPNLGDAFPRWSYCESPRSPGAAPSPPYSPADTTLATTSSTSWEFDDGAYCRSTPCTFAMYAVADCGTAMKLPLYDNESGRIRVYDLLRDVYVPLDAIGGAASCPWQQNGVSEASWQDCAGGDCRWNNATTTVAFGGAQGAVCGVYRIELADWGGYYWDLFANCDGSNTPGFTIYDNVCDALDAYDPVPEIEVRDLGVTGVCPEYAVAFEVVNRGCKTVDVPVRVSISVGGSVDLTVAGVEPGATRAVVTALTAASCSPAVITVTADPADLVRECSEAQGSAVSCNPDPGAGHVATFDLTRPCVDRPVFCGATVAEDLDPCTASGVRISWPEVILSGGGGGALYDLYRDDVLLAGGLAATEWIDSTGVEGLSYRYRVQAVNACGLGDASAVEVVATDAALETVVAAGAVAASTPADCAIHVDWPAAVSAGPISYVVHRGAACPASIDDPVVASLLPLTEFDDPVDAGESYCYLVEAVGSCGSARYPSTSRTTAVDRSPAVALAPATITPAPPCAIRLDWAVADDCGAVVYEVHRSRATPWTPDPWSDVARVSALPFTDVLPIDGRYEYQIIARNQGGLETHSDRLVANLSGCATGCSTARLSARRSLIGIGLSGGHAAWRWSEDPGAAVYHLNAVAAKVALGGELHHRAPRGLAEAVCEGPTPDCVDANPLALDQRIRYYQAVSACGPAGDDEGP